jgi:hypothetical protein
MVKINFRSILSVAVSLCATSALGVFVNSVAVRAENSLDYPALATVTNMVNGDLMCYVDLVDEQGVERHLGADFEVCADETQFLGQKVYLTYGELPVNDCQSIEPCGKTRLEMLITQIDLADNSEAEDAIVLSNGEWTIAVGNIHSWSGANGTGNLSYYGCDSEQNCISLTGGTVTCRDGKCFMSWRNGEYFYTLEQFISEDENTVPPANLIVRKGNTVILRATGFRSL